MAFSKATGYGNLPNGNFSATIYSKQVQLAFRKKSTAQDITNSDYFGEIANFGDTVKIIKEPEITVRPYTRGSVIQAQDLDDEDFSLTINKSNYFAFKVDDIEEAHSHVNFGSLASNRAAYRLADNYDQDVLAYMCGYKQSANHTVGNTVNATVNGSVAVSTAGTDELLSSMKLEADDFGGSTGSSIGIQARAPGATSTVPGSGNAYVLQVIARMARLLNQQNVPMEARWLILDPVCKEILQDEDSRLFNSDFAGANSALKNGLILSDLHGFKVYCSNNLPVIGTGPATTGGTNASNYGLIVAGHSSAIATAEQINKTESYRDTDSFADVVRGMHLYGTKILRPEALVNAKVNLV